ncbi:MAG: ABC transporter permease [Elioraea sp.]|nr:ABC transporter permease [Elioraea sp.]MDW8443141.1 ABC transporter permease [Acetobacteraceae bacterium]
MSGTAAAAITLPERLDGATVPALWSTILPRVQPGAELVLDLRGTRAIDTAGVALILALEERAGRQVRLDGASGEILRLVERGRDVAAQRPLPALEPPESLAVAVGAAAVKRAARWRDGLAFLGRAAAAVASILLKPGTLRLRETVRQAEEIGNRALPLVALIGFLFGLILSFQSALPMRQFGAEIYVASLVSVSVFRELGPLLSSVILAARSGSAFAAEIGTMKVNEEIDALTVMGLDPFRFLVVPRLIAAVAMVPVLIVAMNLTALAGMVTVMTSLGFPFAALSAQVVTWSAPADVFGGLLKGMVFGAVVAGIGCARGMATGVGPRAVGESATAAVVGGIIAIILLDGGFAVFFYVMGW